MNRNGPGQSWHPVTPHIVDPDLAPGGGGNAQWGYSAPQGAALSGQPGVQPPPKGDFFSEHKFAVVVSVVVLVILIVILYVYLTRRGGDKKKGGGASQAATGDGGGLPDNVDASELARLRAMRQARAGGAPAPHGAAAYPGGMTLQQGAPQQGAPQQGVPQQGAPQQGAPQQGAPQQGVPQQGAPQQGAPQQGAPIGMTPAPQIAQGVSQGVSQDVGQLQAPADTPFVPQFVGPPANFAPPGGPQFRGVAPLTAPNPTPKEAKKDDGVDELIEALQDEADVAEEDFVEDVVG